MELPLLAKQIARGTFRIDVKAVPLRDVGQVWVDGRLQDNGRASQPPRSWVQCPLSLGSSQLPDLGSALVNILGRVWPWRRQPSVGETNEQFM